MERYEENLQPFKAEDALAEAPPTNDENASLLQKPGGIPDDEKSTNLEAAYNIYKICIGIGILILPSVFKQTGWLLSLVFLFAAALFCTYCIHLMLKVADHLNDPDLTLFELGERFYGWPMSLAVKICIVFIQGGTGIVYLAFIRDYLNEVSCDLGIEFICKHDFYSMLFAFVIILPLSLITNFHFFAYVSVSASALQMVIFILLSGHHITRLGLFSSLAIANPAALRFTIGNFIFVFEGVPTIMDVRRSMKTPTALASTLWKVNIFATFVCFIFAFLGYWAFGGETESIILFNYNLKHPLFFSLVLGYTLIILLTFPLQFFPILECFQSWEKFRIFVKEINYLRLFRASFVFLFAVCALYLKNIEIAVNFFGSFFAGPLSFIFPIMIYDKYFEKELTQTTIWIHRVLLFIGIVASVIGSAGSIEKVVRLFV